MRRKALQHIAWVCRLACARWEKQDATPSQHIAHITQHTAQHTHTHNPIRARTPTPTHRTHVRTHTAQLAHSTAQHSTQHTAHSTQHTAHHTTTAPMVPSETVFARPLVVVVQALVPSVGRRWRCISCHAIVVSGVGAGVAALELQRCRCRISRISCITCEQEDAHCAGVSVFCKSQVAHQQRRLGAAICSGVPTSCKELRPLTSMHSQQTQQARTPCDPVSRLLGSEPRIRNADLHAFSYAAGSKAAGSIRYPARPIAFTPLFFTCR